MMNNASIIRRSLSSLPKDFALRANVRGKTLPEVIEKVTMALKKHKFGVLTTIDVQKTLKDKIDVDYKPLTILGACSPGFAHAALNVEEEIALFLPCNVTIKQQSPYEETNNNMYEVSAINPKAMMGMLGKEELSSIANQAFDELSAAIEELNEKE